MSKSSLAQFIEHISKADPFDSESFIYSRTMQGNAEDGEYQVRASYVHGSAYIEGLVGGDGTKIKVFYNRLQGIQLWVYVGKEPRVDSWPPHHIDKALEEIIHLAKL